MQKNVSPAAVRSSAWWWSGALVLLILLLQAGGPAVQQAFRLDAAALSQGEWWRLLTAHLVHLSWPHALLNAVGVVTCCVFAPQIFDRQLLWRLGALALGISLCLWRFSPVGLPYVGLSGVLYGLFALGLVPRARQRDGYALAALIIVTLWMVWQGFRGPLPAEEAAIGGPIISAAHFYGYGLALLMLLAACGVRRLHHPIRRQQGHRQGGASRNARHQQEQQGKAR